MGVTEPRRDYHPQLLTFDFYLTIHLYNPNDRRSQQTPKRLAAAALSSWKVMSAAKSAKRAQHSEGAERDWLQP